MILQETSGILILVLFLRHLDSVILRHRTLPVLPRFLSAPVVSPLALEVWAISFRMGIRPKTLLLLKGDMTTRRGCLTVATRDGYKLACTMALLFSSAACGHPTDERLIEVFENHQTEFAQLRTMAASDRSLKSISRDVVLVGGVMLEPRRADDASFERAGFPRRRFEQYARLFEKTGIVGLWIERTEVSFRAELPSMFSGDLTKGIRFSEADLQPLFNNLDAPVSEAWPGYVRFRALKPNWYLYKEWE